MVRKTKYRPAWWYHRRRDRRWRKHVSKIRPPQKPSQIIHVPWWSILFTGVIAAYFALSPEMLFEERFGYEHGRAIVIAAMILIIGFGLMIFGMLTEHTVRCTGKKLCRYREPSWWRGIGLVAAVGMIAIWLIIPEYLEKALGLTSEQTYQKQSMTAVFFTIALLLGAYKDAFMDPPPGGK